MSTKITPTAAHLSDANKIIVEHEQKSAQVPHSSILAYCIAQLIAESEARAVGEVLARLTCTNHTDKQRHECPVCLVTQLREEFATLTIQAAFTADANVSLRLQADQLRAEVERLSTSVAEMHTHYGQAHARAEKAEAELAKERARYRIKEDSGEIWFHVKTPSGLSASINLGRRAETSIVQRTLLESAAVDAAMKEDGK